MWLAGSAQPYPPGTWFYPLAAPLIFAQFDNRACGNLAPYMHLLVLRGNSGGDSSDNLDALRRTEHTNAWQPEPLEHAAPLLVLILLLSFPPLLQ